jgi:hypothetical protein
MGRILTRRFPHDKAERGLKRAARPADAGEVGSSIWRRSEGSDMRRMHVQHRTSRRDDPPRALPIDPRDPDVLRAKQLKRANQQAPAKASR